MAARRKYLLHLSTSSRIRTAEGLLGKVGAAVDEKAAQRFGIAQAGQHAGDARKRGLDSQHRKFAKRNRISQARSPTKPVVRGCAKSAEIKIWEVHSLLHIDTCKFNNFEKNRKITVFTSSNNCLYAVYHP